MKNFNELSLKEFFDILKKINKVFDIPSKGAVSILSQINSECRLAKEMILAIEELKESKNFKEQDAIASDYRVIIAIWVLLNDPEILNELYHQKVKSELQ